MWTPVQLHSLTVFSSCFDLCTLHLFPKVCFLLLTVFPTILSHWATKPKSNCCVHSQGCDGLQTSWGEKLVDFVVYPAQHCCRSKVATLCTWAIDSLLYGCLQSIGWIQHGGVRNWIDLVGQRSQFDPAHSNHLFFEIDSRDSMPKNAGSSKMSHIHRSSDFIRLRRLRRNLLHWDILQPQLRWAWLETHDALQGWVTRTRWCDPLQFSTFYNAKQSLQLYYRITTVQLHYTTQMSMLCLLLPCWASVLFDFESFLSGKKRMEETSLLTEGYDSSDAFVEVGLNGCIWEGLLFAFALGLL